jgi:hypothetical protein
VSSLLVSRPNGAARERLVQPRFTFAAGILVLLGAAYLVFSTSTATDYGLHIPVVPDNAAPAVNALAHAHLGAYLSHQPVMGMLSLLLRAPVARVVELLGGGQMLVYRLGALACLLPLVALATWIVHSARAGGRTAVGLTTAAVLVVGPMTIAAIGWGHPEEVLAATLVTCSLLAATRERPTWAGLAAGAAIGSKEWALIVVPPMLLALSRDRARALIAAASTTLLLVTPPVLLDPRAFARATHALGSSTGVIALSAWWHLAIKSAPPPGSLGRTLPLHLTKTYALALGLGLVGLPATLCAFVQARRAPSRRAPDAFALLCLLALVRCLADPAPVDYYYVAAVFPLAAWEATTLRRVPIAATITLVAVWFSFEHGYGLSPGALNALTFAWAVPMISYVASHALAIELPRVRKLEMGVPT